MPLWAVDGDKNTDINGGLNASSGDSSPCTVFINGKNVIVGTTDAAADDKCPPLGGKHCNPKSAAHSSDVFAYSKPAHRHADSRACGATTVVSGQNNVYVN